ncbi:complement C1q-like protein 4 [Mizuhopecten yessoensis]|uniref:Heavy metal-binding protein HIP n=1 Tax=Mizuhopecten yessoensis TaxID=6573 RepID=A0A210Q7C9_MIZYE|nr:complement C1q-like protein 4 [Mizuhopecten yessoensis]OWF44640.1 Heavy metal-binding protein HIP [Mizuhopecten yessoensis]
MGRIIQFIWSVMVMIALVKSNEDFEYRLKQMEQKFASQLQAVREDACSNSKGISDNIRDRRVVNKEEPVIAFSTQLGPEKNNLGVHQTLIFEGNVMNEGSAYSNLTGVFTCPKAGMYYFSVTIMVRAHDEFETELVHNGRNIMVNYAAGESQFKQATNSVVIRLNEGDKVWVRILENLGINNGNIRIYGGGWTTFTGFRIQ